MISPSTHHPPECDLCLYQSGSPYLRCAVHPMGTSYNPCPDFEPDPNPMPVPEWVSAEQWCGVLVLEMEDFECELEMVDELDGDLEWEGLEEVEEDEED